MPITEESILQQMETQRVKALRALVKYKFWMFGYHAANWVNLNKLLDTKQPNPFRYLLHSGVFMLTETAAKRDEDVWGEDVVFPRADWRHEVGDNDTSLGYWEWVASQYETHGRPGES